MYMEQRVTLWGAGGMEGSVEGLCGGQVEWRVVLKDSVGGRWNGGWC